MRSANSTKRSEPSARHSPRFATILALAVATTAVGGCPPGLHIGGGTSLDIKISDTEQLSGPHVAQAEPAVAFFGDPAARLWVTCYNDDTHRGDAQPAASGITCALTDGQRVTQRVAIVGQAPFGSGDPYPATDPSLSRDPIDANTVWLSAVMFWNSATAGRRISIGIGRLVFSPVSRRMELDEPSPGCCGDAHRMVPIAGTKIESSLSETIPDRPQIAIDPTPDAQGNHAQYLVFYQDDRVNHQGRIAVARRDDSTVRFWSEAVPVLAENLGHDPNGYVPDQAINPTSMDLAFFQAPQITVHPTDHSVAVAYSRVGEDPNPPTDADPTIRNNSVGPPIQYFFGVSHDSAHTQWTAFDVAARSLTPPPNFAAEGRVVVGFSNATTNRSFPAVPYPVIAFDQSNANWVAVVTHAQLDDFQGPTPFWQLSSVHSSDDGQSWSTPVALPTSTPRSFSNQLGNVAFPAMAYDTTVHRLVVGFLQSTSTTGQLWQPEVVTSLDGGGTWTPTLPVAPPSEPVPARLIGTELYSWGGFWAGSARAGYFGDYTGITVANGVIWYAWADSRDSWPTQGVIDVWAAEVRE